MKRCGWEGKLFLQELGDIGDKSFIGERKSQKKHTKNSSSAGSDGEGDAMRKFVVYFIFRWHKWLPR